MIMSKTHPVVTTANQTNMFNQIHPEGETEEGAGDLTTADVHSDDQSSDDSCQEPGDDVKTANSTRTLNMFSGGSSDEEL